MKNDKPTGYSQNNDLIKESYFLFEKVLRNKGTLLINRKIYETVSALYERHGLTSNDLLHSIFTDYLEKSLYLKHDPGKTKLSTFVLHCTYYLLKEIEKKYARLFKHYKETPLILDCPEEEQLSERIGISINILENGGHPGLVTSDTPEDLLIANELLGLFENNFSDLEMEVLLGKTDRFSAAEKIAVGYETFKKHLQRKINLFKPVLADLGYCY